MFERALIVEDNESSRYYLKALLEAKGKLVETASNGEEALMSARRTRPQLLVSDLLMPVMDGFSLLIEWLEDPELNTIPFVVYTGTFTSEEDRQLALHIGANAFLVKPMEPDELMDSLEKTVVDFIPDRRVAAERKLEFSRRHADVLVRKLTERNRELERERLARNREILEKEALLDALHADVAILDSRGRILQVNESWRRTARENDRASSTYGVGGSYFETIEGPDKNAIRASIQAVLSGELTSYFTDFPSHSKHRKCWFRMVVTPLRSSEAAAIVMHIDVSERKLLEEQLLRAQRLESIGNLAGGVAHDLNNSLAPITVAVDLLKAEIRDEAQLELLSSIEKSGTKGRDLVRQLLLFARGEARERRPVPLSDPLDEVYRLARDTFPERIELQYEIDAGAEVVQADPTQLYQVFLNLCLNARDAIEGEGCIVIRAGLVENGEAAIFPGSKRGAPYIRVEFKDTGHGISETDTERIFEPFFTTKESNQGTGLGLSTSKSIIESHGGYIELESRVGQGTTFRVYLPVCREPAVDPSEEVQDPPPTDQTILVVDDEATIRELVVILLEAAGYKAVGVGNGLEALSRFRKSPESFFALLTDLTMPGMSGVELVAQMRELRPDLKVVVCTGLDVPSEGPLKSLEQPYSFLRKPCTGRELVQAVEACKTHSSNPT